MTTPKNNVISLLGVQGLSRNNYSVVQLKVVLAIISHAQKVINDYVVDGEMPNRSIRKYLTHSQLACGYSAVVMRLSELCQAILAKKTPYKPDACRLLIGRFVLFAVKTTPGLFAVKTTPGSYRLSFRCWKNRWFRRASG